MPQLLWSPSRWRLAFAVLIAVVALFACAFAAAGQASAAYYKMVACSANNGAPPYQVATNASEVFQVLNQCGGQGGDPPGESAFIRVHETQDAPHTVRQGAYEDVYFDAPPSVHFKAAGGFTREPYQFAEGWRARFWIAEQNSTTQIMAQGAGGTGEGLLPSSSVFGPHIWPEGGYRDFNRFVFELECVRASRCEAAGNNAADLNGMVFILSDDSPSDPEFTQAESPLLSDHWVRGNQAITFNVSDAGSGIREERVYVDGDEIWSLDHGLECATSVTPSNGEWARSYSPCPTGGPWNRSIAFNTAAFKDGSHTVQVCTQDFAQFQGLNGTGGQSCTARTIATDNTAPAAPSELSIVTPNPARYLSHFGAQFTLPPNEGSPITKAFYNVVDAAGNVVVPAQEVNGVNPTAIQTINGPEKAGDYRLQVWLEDEVGLVGPPASVPIPHDTTPPAAPQDLTAVAPKSAKGAAGFDLTWHNIVDSGAPIDAAHYRILDAEGATVVEDQTVDGENVEAISNLETPRDRGGFTLQLWLEDAEGNVGAPTSVPLVYECVRDTADAGAALSSSIGPEGAGSRIVRQGGGGLLQGRLLDANGAPVGEAPICVFSQVVTGSVRKFLGVAITSADGSWEFAVKPGATRNLMVAYRSQDREIDTKVTLVTRVRPTIEIENTVVDYRNVARFHGTVPGPDNEHVQVVLQARKGKGWIVFRRLSTGKEGIYKGSYRFNKTLAPTEYVIRAEVRKQPGYPYASGTSEEQKLIVYPHREHSSAHRHAGKTDAGGHHKKRHRHRRHKNRDQCSAGSGHQRHCQPNSGGRKKGAKR
jgi:hypothetical protein